MSSEYIRIATAQVDQARITGKTRHYGDQLLTSPTRLEIVQLPPDSGFYLLYIDGNGAEMTDTWHESLERAMDQANFEFGLLPNEWEQVAPH
jgi:hypothetical protein